ncbi:MAG TPA: glycosyltransferase [candidate division Zixibacteria bacterium]
MPPAKKICLITNRYPTYADDVASPFVRDFHLGLKEKGVEVSVFTPHYQSERENWTNDIVRFHWRGGKKVVGSLNFLNPLEMFQLFSFMRNGRRQLFEHLRNTTPTSCLALWALPSGWFAYQAKRKLGIPYSVWCLGSDIYVWAKRPVLRGLTRKILQGADHLFADGFDLKEKVEKLSGNKCIFLPSMRKLPQGFEEKEKLDNGRFNFLYIGRWEKDKGLDTLIPAFDVLIHQLSKVNLYILGWGSYEKEIRKQMRNLDLEEHIKIIGKVTTNSVANYMEQADCVVIPSKGDSIPLVFSEALQMGTPLIVTDVGDLGYLVRRFKLGKVVIPGDIDSLAKAMIEFVKEDNNYYENIPEALKLLDIENAVNDYLNILDPLITPQAHLKLIKA